MNLFDVSKDNDSRKDDDRPCGRADDAAARKGTRPSERVDVRGMLARITQESLTTRKGN